MISTLIGLYAAGVLGTSNVPSGTSHVMPWNENILEISQVPAKNEENIAPVIQAKAAIVVDLQSGLILYEKNIHDPLPIASLTKLMTALVILEENDPKETATISRRVSQTIGSKIWLAEGEKISVENLLYAALIPSANDAAMALAEHNANDIPTFVQKMNTRAAELGLYSTLFRNPTGLDDTTEEPQSEEPEEESTENLSAPPDLELRRDAELQQGVAVKQTRPDMKNMRLENYPGNISTAYDMTLLGRYAYGKSFIRRAVTKKELDISSINQALSHKLNNTNQLLDSYLTVLGLKTGTTDSAGECLIGIFADKNENTIITVVLNSSERYTESKILADWAFRTYTW